MAEIKLSYPPSTNRYWRIGRGRIYASDDAKKYKTEAGWAARAAGYRKPMEGPVRVSVALHPRRNKSGTPSQNRLDLDNCLKIALDALNGVAWLDDWQIVEIRAVLAHPVEGGGLSVQVFQGEIRE